MEGHTGISNRIILKKSDKKSCKKYAVSDTPLLQMIFESFQMVWEF